MPKRSVGEMHAFSKALFEGTQLMTPGKHILHAGLRGILRHANNNPAASTARRTVCDIHHCARGLSSHLACTGGGCACGCQGPAPSTAGAMGGADW